MRYLILAVMLTALITPAVAVARPDSSDGSPAAPAPAPPPPPIVDVAGSGTDGTFAWPSGCRNIDVSAAQKSFLFHVLIYRFHQIEHWCWHNGIVYDERHAWSFDGSSTACFDTVYPDNSWFFTWWHNKANSGHYSEERAHVTNCVFHIGDWKEFYPDVKIWVYADGTYKSTTEN